MAKYYFHSYCLYVQYHISHTEYKAPEDTHLDTYESEVGIDSEPTTAGRANLSTGDYCHKVFFFD